MAVDKDKNPPKTDAGMRRRAEKQLQGKPPALQPPRTKAEAQRLIHELEVHQIELEMQHAELRQARDEAEKSLELYTELYDCAPVGYITLDRAGTIRATNLTFANLLGIERSRLTGRRFGLLVAVEDHPVFTAFLDEVFSNPAKLFCEIALLKGDALPLIVRIEAVAATSGQECRVAIIDISQRRQLEESLEVLNTDLQAYAAELEAANAELEAFNYSVSHDLRGPLTVIAGYCELVEDLCGSNLGEDCRGYIGKIHEGSIQMNQLIDTLLNFSSVKRVEMLSETVDLSKMAQDVAMKLKMAEPECGVRFRIAAGVTAEGDANLLQLVLVNLMGNAWKYSRNTEEAVIEFGAMTIAGKPTYFVRDNGPGFDMAHAETLFKPFQRLPGTTVGGHGIGLAIVDRIVGRHGGKVWAESKPGLGATFLFTLG